MPFEPDFISDGDAASALSVNATFNDAKAWIDALDLGSTRRGAFNHRHAGRTIRSSGPITAEWRPAVGSKIYSRALFTSSLQYTGWNNNQATDTALNNPTGDRVVIGHPSAGGAGAVEPASIVFTGYRLGPNRDLVGCVWVLANVHVESMFQGNGSDMEVMVCIQFQVNGTNWRTLTTSERFLSHKDHTLEQAGERTFFDIPISALVTPDDLDEIGGIDPAVDEVTGIRLCLSLRGSGSTSIVTIERWNMSVLPLFCELS